MNLVLLFDDDFGSPAARAACDAGEVARAEFRGRRLDHLRLVHRAGTGRELKVGRLGGRVGTGVIEAINELRAVLRVQLDGEPPRKVALTLLLSLPRPRTLRRVLQAVATLGIARLVLMNSWRVEKSCWQSPRLAPAAMQAELLLGLEQGRDTVLPVVETRRLLVPFAKDELDTLAAGSRRLIAHPGVTQPCPRALSEPITLALGPEGGFIDREIELFGRHGFEVVTIGPRPLRVEQAIPALVGRLT